MVWEEIFSENSEALGRRLDRAIEILSDWRERISPDGAPAEIESVLERVQRQRLQIAPEHKKADS